MPGVRPKKFAWYHEEIINWMIANPGRPLSECARHVNKTQAWLSTIINSDMFKAALAERRRRFEGIHDGLLVEKTTQIAMKGMDLILEHMEKKRDSIPLETLHKVADSAMSRLGYGVKTPSTAVQVNVNNGASIPVAVSAEDLAAARTALRAAEQQKALPPVESTKLLEGEVLGPERNSVEEDDVSISIPA